MSNFSITSQSASSLRAPNSYGAKIADQRSEGISFDLTMRVYELESQNDLLKEENERLLASNMELEKECHDQRRLLYDREAVIIKQKADGVFLEETVKMLKEMYETLREGSERRDKKWKDLLESKQKCWRLEFDYKKLEMDLRRGADRIAELTEKMKAAEILLKEKDVTISEMAKKIENLEEEKMKIGDELGHQVLKLKKSVEEWAHCTVSGGVTRIAIDDLGSNVQHKGTGNSERSGRKSIGISPLIYPNLDSIEADEQLTGPVIEKNTCTPKTTDANIIEISDDEEEEEEKQIPSFASPSSAKLVPATKRKSEEATWSAEKQDEAAKRCRSNGPTDGKLWQDVKQMKEAFKSNDELSMKSVCALNVMDPPFTRDSHITLVYRRRGKGINSN